MQEYCTNVTDGTHATPKKVQYGYPLVTSKNLNNGRLDLNNTYLISESDYNEINTRSKVDKNDVLISMIGTVGLVCFVDRQPDFAIKNVGLLKNKDEFHGKWLYYYLSSPEGQYSIQERLRGTTQQYIPLNEIRKLPVKVLFSMDDMKKIVNFLSYLDDKIELNTQINHNLEEQARAIFREYFQPHEKVVPLGSLCQCLLGGTPNRNRSEFWGGDIPWINSGKVNEFRITTASEYITDSGLKNSSTKFLPCHTTVIAITGATLGQVSLLEIASCANQSVVGVLPNDNVPFTFIYPFIKDNILELISNQTGGAQQHINKQNVESLPVPCYSAVLITEYHERVSPLYEQISNNCFESERLIDLRDLLLPKLMSGEIDVSEVEV